MSQLKADDPDYDQEDRDQADDVVRVSEEKDAADHRTGGADPCPYCVGCSNRDFFHRLGNREKAQHDEGDCDDAGYKLAEPLAVFQRDGKTNLKKTRQK